jgi:hypothetical protein
MWGQPDRAGVAVPASMDEGAGIVIGYELLAHCEAMKSELCRDTNLYKDAVQRARASQRPSPRRLHGFPAAPMHEDLRGSGA